MYKKNRRAQQPLLLSDVNDLPERSRKYLRNSWADTFRRGWPAGARGRHRAPAFSGRRRGSVPRRELLPGPRDPPRHRHGRGVPGDIPPDPFFIFELSAGLIVHVVDKQPETSVHGMRSL